MAATSSRLTAASSSSSAMVLESFSTTHTMGKSTMMMSRRARVVNPMSFFQWREPMVLGMISEKTSIRMVVMADTSPNHWLPKTSVA